MSTVLIFDSGVGGLSISLSLSKGLRGLKQLYLADGEYFPYGDRLDEVWLIQRVLHLLKQAVQRFNPDCIVVACNTVSTLALEALRSEISIPIIGVVPAIKPAAEKSITKSIALLATPRTIASKYTQSLISTFANDCEVLLIGTTELVRIAESKIFGRPVIKSDIAHILKPVITANQYANIDHLVLGCTHFPLVAEIISEIISDNNAEGLATAIQLIDSSSAITQQVATILELLVNADTMDSMNGRPPNHDFYTTASIERGGTGRSNPLSRYGYRSAIHFNASL